MSPPSRILATHVGSLPRPQAVADQVMAQERGDAVDEAEFDAVVGEGVRQVVRLQRDAGIDIPSDGDMSKVGYVTYLRHRLSGFEMQDSPRLPPADLVDFPQYLERWQPRGAAANSARPVCVAPVEYVSTALVEADLRRMKAALADAGVEEGFITAPSPGVIAQFQPDAFYGDHEAYLMAIAEAMRAEYQVIVAAGLILQIDAPDLAMGRHSFYRDATDDEFVAAVDLHVRALNHALRDLPSDRMRMHLCWGNYEGPHTRDIPLQTIIDGVLKARPSGLLFEAANPRHSHEWAVWRSVNIPQDKILIPGTIASTSNYVEHPLVVAERLGHFVDLVGVERVMAGSDCGFGALGNSGPVEQTVTWAKFAAMAEGARIASA